MAYQIEYAYTSHMGKVRGNNEDNFWCCGHHLAADNQGMPDVQCGTAFQEDTPMFGVFDGMGGESCGEIAAYLAADACTKQYADRGGEDTEALLLECCGAMNRAVCAYAQENRIRSMGTTAAMMAFGREEIICCNLGDSRIYHFGPEGLAQISTDHVLKSAAFGKAPLTQYVGIPEESMALEPSVFYTQWETGDRYLLCSDGVTDMLSDREIEEILGVESPPSDTVRSLLDSALDRGGKDNVTIVLCEIQEMGIRGRIGHWMERLRRKV